ncbi:MAG: shikimate kinase [Alphaproteobacteria bacterium]|nr:shikimate kinase [Alphaproteobacteria bacterium]
MTLPEKKDVNPDPQAALNLETPPALPYATRSIVLVGMMGAGKTTVGRRLASAMRLPFCDTDAEIEAAAGCSIADFFEKFGEPAFRDGERKVITRLLEGPRQVLATGGGAFIDPDTRARIKSIGLSIWLRADVDVLLKRVMKRHTRPLLKKGDPRETILRLIDQRYPIYAEADIVLDTIDGPHDAMVVGIQSAIAAFLKDHP